MALHQEAASNRKNFSFATEGLPAREELLLKSLIRVLDHRTRHGWIYQPDQADLWILAEGTIAATSGSKTAVLQLRVVGVNKTAADHELSLPFKAGDIEAILNRLGDRLEQHSVAQITRKTQSSEPAYRLLRWPPAQLVGQVEHRRIATLLLSSSLSISDLSKRSGQNEKICQEFVDMLKQTDCLKVSHTEIMRPSLGAQAATLLPIEKSLSIFARIRNRLTQPILGSKAR
jgi:hypothetical protein